MRIVFKVLSVAIVYCLFESRIFCSLRRWLDLWEFTGFLWISLPWLDMDLCGVFVWDSQKFSPGYMQVLSPLRDHLATYGLSEPVIWLSQNHEVIWEKTFSIARDKFILLEKLPKMVKFGGIQSNCI